MGHIDKVVKDPEFLDKMKQSEYYNHFMNIRDANGNIAAPYKPIKPNEIEQKITNVKYNVIFALNGKGLNLYGELNL